MPRSAFGLEFKEDTGEVLMKYLARWRMLLAGDKLANSGEPVSALPCCSAMNPRVPSART
jgi:AraC-like DNA-binding protein